MMQLAARGAQHTVTLFNALFFLLASRCVANFLISHFEFGNFDSRTLRLDCVLLHAYLMASATCLVSGQFEGNGHFYWLI